MRIFLSFIVIVTLSAPISIPAFASNADVLKENMTMAQRLENIVSPILINNPEICGNNKRFYSGAEFMTQDGVGKSYQDLVRDMYGVGKQPTVTIIGQDSPASKVLQIGDQILEVNHKAVHASKDGQYMIEDAIAEGRAVDLTIKHRGQDAQHTVTLTPASVCAVKVRLDNAQGNDIRRDNEKIIVEKGAMNTKNDAQLAAAIKGNLKAN